MAPAGDASVASVHTVVALPRPESEYAGATGKHTKWVYLRERDVLGVLDAWLLERFNKKNIDATIAAVVAGRGPDRAAVGRVEAAKRRIADCDDRLAKYRAALEAGGDSEVIVGWIKEVEAERHQAERDRDGRTEPEPMSEDEIRDLVVQVKTGLVGLSKGSPEQKAAIYRTLGLKLTYHPEDDTLDIELHPDAYTRGRVGGGT